MNFYEIVIKLFFSDHPSPHFHVIYGEYNALFDIQSLEVIEGDLLSRAKKLTLEWAALYQRELLEMWEKHQFHNLPPLE